MRTASRQVFERVTERDKVNVARPDKITPAATAWAALFCLDACPHYGSIGWVAGVQSFKKSAGLARSQGKPAMGFARALSGWIVVVPLAARLGAAVIALQLKPSERQVHQMI